MNRLLDPFHRVAALRRARTAFTDEKLRLLRSSDLFQDLSPEDVEHIEQMTVMSRYRRGELVYAPGDTPEALFLLKRGRIEVYRLDEEGRKLTVSTVHADMAFGDMALTGQRMLGSYAEAVEDCMLCVMKRADVEALVLEYPRVGIRLIRLLADRLADLEARLAESSLRDIPSRVAAALLRAAEQDGPTITTTHQRLAEVVGTHRETVTRTLGDFRDRRLIRITRSQVEVLDFDGLRAAANHR